MGHPNQGLFEATHTPAYVDGILRPLVDGLACTAILNHAELLHQLQGASTVLNRALFVHHGLQERFHCISNTL
jgi:hypothetical protein